MSKSTVGGARARDMSICVLCECSCHVHLGSLHSAHTNLTIDQYAPPFLQLLSGHITRARNCVKSRAKKRRHSVRGRKSARDDSRRSNAACRWCDCSCDVQLCSLLCCSLGGASALVTFISSVLCTLRTQISRSICTFTPYQRRR
jgi:hypothetical protein